MDDEAWTGARRAVTEGAMETLEAFEEADVQEAYEAWIKATLDVASVLDRRGMKRSVIAAQLAGGMMGVLHLDEYE